jgi:hypothetical protein
VTVKSAQLPAGWVVLATEPESSRAYWWTGKGWSLRADAARAYARRQDALRAAGCLNRGVGEIRTRGEAKAVAS